MFAKFSVSEMSGVILSALFGVCSLGAQNNREPVREWILNRRAASAALLAII